MNTKLSSAPIVRIPPDTAAAVGRGHPWIFGQLRLPEVGTPVRLEDPRGRIVGYGLADRGDITVRVLGVGAPPEQTLAELVRHRVQRADTFRNRVVGGQTDAWRILNGGGDGLPGLVLDRYADVAVCKIYSRAWVPHLDTLKEAVRGLGWSASMLRRFGVKSVDGKEGAEPLFGKPPESVVVTEHGMKMLVRPWTGQKTGTFLDQREHRRIVGEISAGRRVANLFAYNGGFSLAAALGGASQVITVDIAEAAIEDARENFRLNGLDPEAHVFEATDAFAWRPKGRLGVLVVDPPSLTRTVKARGAALSAYRKLHAGLGDHVERDGLVASSSCTAQIDWEHWTKAVAEGLSKHGPWSWCWQSRAPMDHPVALGHPEGHYLKFALLRRL
ncbi:MAG: class I SAM-dependent rRNA methyltransferase [Myxococcota bacterium]